MTRPPDEVTGVTLGRSYKRERTVPYPNSNPDRNRTVSVSYPVTTERVGPSVAFSNLMKQLQQERKLRAKAESDRDQERADKLAIQDTLGHVLQGMKDRDNGER